MGVVTERLALLVDAKTGGAARDFQKLRKEIDGTGKTVDGQIGKFDKFANKIGVSSSVLKAGLATAAVAAGGAVVKFGLDAGKAASDLVEATNATRVVFKGAAADVIAWSKTTADGFGVSSRAALDAASSFGGVFTNIGLTEKQAASLSKGMVQLAGDLSSLRNLSTAESMQKLQSGLAGEIEPLRRLGVDVSEAAVKMKALELGIEGVDGQLSQSQKTMVRYKLIMEQLDEAQGDAARTAEDFANAERRAAANAEDLRAAFGESVNKKLAESYVVINNLGLAIKRLGGQSESAKSPVSTFFDTVVFNGPGLKIMGSLLGKVAGEQDRAGESADTYAASFKTLDSALRSGTLSADEVTETLTEQRKITDEVAQKLMAYGDAQRSLAASGRSVAEAERGVSDARSELNRLLREGKVDADAVAQAQRRLESANRSLKSAHEQAADAQKDYNRLLQTSPVDLEEVTRATRGLERASRDLSRAHEGVVDAQRRLNELQNPAAIDREQQAIDLERAEIGVTDAEERLIAVRADSEATAADLRDAELDLAQAKIDLIRLQEDQKVTADELATAQRGVADAEYNLKLAAEGVAQATTDLSTAQRGNKDHADLLATAQKRVADANDDVAVALRGVLDATGELLTAQAGDPEFADKIANAKRELAKAEQGVADARIAETKATVNLNTAAARRAELLATEPGAVAAVRREYEKLGALSLFGTKPTAPTGQEYLPHFHSGGVVGGPPSRNVPAVLKGQEVVFENAAAARKAVGGAAGGDTINIYPPAGADDEWVVRALLREKRRRGSLPI